MTTTVPVSEAESRLSELLRRVEGGEGVVTRRGALRGRIVVSDDFHEPLAELDAYRGGS